MRRTIPCIKTHIIHCSDSTFGDVKKIREWHQQRGWQDVGYHFIIRRDGEIELGRPLNEIGAHCKGKNRESIGTCLIGKKRFTEAQFNALKKLNTMLKSIFSELEIYAHNEFNAHKTCPNFDVRKVLEND